MIDEFEDALLSVPREQRASLRNALTDAADRGQPLLQSDEPSGATVTISVPAEVAGVAQAIAEHGAGLVSQFFAPPANGAARAQGDELARSPGAGGPDAGVGGEVSGPEHVGGGSASGAARAGARTSPARRQARSLRPRADAEAQGPQEQAAPLNGIDHCAVRVFADLLTPES
jgi:hypothetical protein